MILPDCTIIIPTRNRAEDLTETVRLLCGQGLGETPCVVVDDASDDPGATREAVSALTNAEVIVHASRGGAARARNTALRHATTRYCFFLDDDSHPETAEDLYRILSSPLDDRVAVWRFDTVRERDGYRGGIPAAMPPTPIHTFLGYGVLMHRECVLNVGAYRPCYIYRHEEDDLALRLFRSGLQIRYEPSVRIIHRHTAAARHDAEYARLSVRNVLLLYSLNWPQPLGLAFGIAKSLSVLLKGRGHKPARIAGLFAGIGTTFREWRGRTPFSYSQIAQYRRLRKQVAALAAEHGSEGET